MDINRRNFLKASAISVSTISLAGCTEPGEQVSELPQPMIGNEESSVEIHVFEDYSCGVCREYVLNHFPNLKSDYIDEDLISYYHHDWPIPVHPRWSNELANAARAVQDKQGVDAFFDFAKTVYENQSNMDVDVIRNAAENAGVSDVEYVLESGSNQLYSPVINKDFKYGQTLGVRGTPTVFVGGDNFDELEMLPDYRFQTIAGVIEAQLD